MMNMEQLNDLAQELRVACDREEVAHLRAREWRQRRVKIIGRIKAILGEEETYVFLQMMKSQAGCLSDFDYHHAVDYPDDFGTKPRVVK
jgi:hypothetical protein